MHIGYFSPQVMPEKSMPSVSQHVFSMFSELQSVTAGTPRVTKRRHKKPQSENTVKLLRVAIQKRVFLWFLVQL